VFFYTFLVIIQVSNQNQDSILNVFIISVFFIFIFIPLHCLTGYLQGLGIIRRIFSSSSSLPVPLTEVKSENEHSPTSEVPVVPSELPMPSDYSFRTVSPCSNCFTVTLLPVFFRTLFFWQLSIWYIIITQDYLWLGLGIPISFVIFLFVIGYIKKYESKLPLEYRQRIGYLVIPGFAD